jgi:hypothetical protein
MLSFVLLKAQPHLLVTNDGFLANLTFTTNNNKALFADIKKNMMLDNFSGYDSAPEVNIFTGNNIR